jgi:hypothetical protein
MTRRSDVAGIYIPWLGDAARLTGFPVVEVTGWRTRGHGGYRVVEGVTPHHTGGAATGEYPSLGVVRDGRADLAGPLSAYGIGRSGTIYVIAAGVSWHAGASRWAGFTDLNDEFLGIEAESTGTGVWTAAQRDVYPRLCAAALYYMSRDASRIGAHREVCLPAGRKVDPTGIDMPTLRAQVATMLIDPLHRIPRNAATSSTPTQVAPAPAPRPRKDDAMYIKCKPYADRPDVWVAILSGGLFVGLGSSGEKESANLAIKAGATEQWVERFTWDAFDQASHRLHDNPRPVRIVTPAPPAP